MSDYSRQGHSVEDYGREFGIDKIKFNNFKEYSKELEDYCIRDVDITHKIYNKLLPYISKDIHKTALLLEHMFQYYVINILHTNGFRFNTTKANTLLTNVKNTLLSLDNDIHVEFHDRLKCIRVVEPALTKYGTLHRKDFRFLKDGNISDYNGGPFSRCRWVPFNPSSHRQIIKVLTEAGWSPTDKTQTHIDTEREANRLKYLRGRDPAIDLRLSQCYTKIMELRKFGWKINENNLSTLPPEAPSPARTLAQRILVESRRRTLSEWLGLVSDARRIHGNFFGIGAWTHRMASQKPNMQNIPNATKEDGSVKYLGEELRSLWIAGRNRLLIGVDAEGIQLRIFAHYINEKEFTEALIRGKKEDKSDPHSLNKRVLGDVCKTRQAAKRFIYALLLGGGIGRLAQILEASEDETKDALGRLMARYQGFTHLKETLIPADAQRGYFIGLDGRTIRIPGETVSQRKHLCMSGYLQSGEAIVMKMACLRWINKLKDYDAILVNFVHDEWQTECPNNMSIALEIAKLQADSLREVGEELNLRCPLAGSYWNEDRKDFTIGTNWSTTH